MFIYLQDKKIKWTENIKEFNVSIFEDIRNYIADNYMFELLDKRMINNIIMDLDYSLKHLMTKRIIFSYNIKVKYYTIIITLISPEHKEFTRNINLI